MVITNFYNMFHAQGKNVFGANGFLGMAQTRQNNPVIGTLNQLAENAVMTTKQDESVRRTDSLTLAARLKADESRESVLSELSDEELKMLRAIYSFGAQLTGYMEADLTEYRDQLSAFDQSIQQYQQMLDGTTAMPEDMSEEEAGTMLKAMQEARDTFLRDGADKLNEANQYRADKLLKDYGEYADVIDDSFSWDLKQSPWKIDADAKDIYGEVDRALSAVQKMKKKKKKGIAMIDKELERRKHSDDPYMDYFEQQRMAGGYLTPPLWNGGVSIFHDTYEAVREILQQAAEGKSEDD